MPGKTGPSVQDMGIDTGAEKDKSYREEEDIDGVHIIVEWDENYGDYVIIFPDVKAGEGGVPDNVLRINSDEVEEAKGVLEKAVKLANNEKVMESEDPTRAVFDRIEKYIGSPTL